MDIKFGCDLPRFWSPLGSHWLPFGSLKVAEMAPKIQSKSDRAANCNSASLFSPFWLQLAPFLNHFSSLLPPFSDPLGIILKRFLDLNLLAFLLPSMFACRFTRSSPAVTPALRAQYGGRACEHLGRVRL